RWIAPWKNSATKPEIYHAVSRIVGRNFVVEVDEREHFRMLMRMCEKFTGCRVLSYCLMSNHFHLLLEVPPMPEGGISNEELLQRLRVFYSEAQVAEIAKEMEDATAVRTRGEFEMPPVDENGAPVTPAQELAMARQQGAQRVEEIRRRYTRRMHDLSEFMKSLLERFTKWFNRTHSRSGTLWEDRFKSVIVESGVAARTMAAYIDLNPVRAGMVKDPADYRWSSYGEAVGGGAKGNGKKAREGLVRAYFCDQGVGFEAEKWCEVSRLYRRLMGLALERKPGRAQVAGSGSQLGQTAMNTAEMLEKQDNETVLQDLGIAKMLRCRVRYFTDGAVIGSREFVNEAFAGARERFGAKRNDGARRLRGSGAAAAGTLWSLRDLRVNI
ncbi:MAG: transposase, partial [Akkermansiaceae bacterium]